MKNNRISKFIAAFSLLFTAACASTTQNGADGINDPLEPLNRVTHGFNKGVDKVLFSPLTIGYQTIIPEIPRKGISNVMRNLREPWTFVNDILQLKFGRAATTLSRLIVNSTVGIGGLFKASEAMDIEYHSEDLGQTFAVWGIGDSPFIVLPFIGPSNGRDAIGFGAYIFADPVTIGISKLNGGRWNLARTGVDALDARSRNHETLKNLYDDEDGYEFMRSAYRQNRLYEVHDGNPPQADSDIFDDLDDEEFEDDPDADSNNR